MNDRRAFPPHRPSRPPWLLLTGAALLAGAAAVHRQVRQAEEEHPPTGDFVEAHGVRLHYVESGEGDPLVLLHGRMTMGLDFLMSGLVHRAAGKYRVIVFDRPGYGYSDPLPGGEVAPEAQARVLHEALRRIGAERPIVVGHSWGALVAMAMALDQPRSVRALVLLSGYLYPTARLDTLLEGPAALPGMGDLMRHTVSPLLYRAGWPLMLRMMFGPGEMPAHFRRFPAWMALRPGPLRSNAAESGSAPLAARRLARRYRELAVPLVIAAGGGDRMVDPEAHSGRLHAELPRSEYRLLEGLGHMIHHLAPDAVMAAIDSAAGLAPLPHEAPMTRPAQPAASS